MKADNINLLEFIGSSKRTFNIPVYQRNYDWKISHCERLFQDIIKIANDDNRETHFLGTIVYIDGIRTATFREFIVIDGQQRLTSIMLLLKALSEEISDDNIKADIRELYLTNVRAPQNFRIKLKPIKSDSNIYEKIINGEKYQSNESNISKNYNYFMKLIKESKLPVEKIYHGVQKLEIVYIELNNQKENPQLVFESLNSTGLDLTQADLIRNYLLMGQPYLRQYQLYKQYWFQIEILLPNITISDFIRDFLTLKTSLIPNKDNVYNNFKNYYEELSHLDVELLLKELLKFAQYYSWFKYCNCKNDKVNERLKQLQRLKSTVVYPFLLNIFEKCYFNKYINEDEIIKILDVIISYVFRRLICDIPTNALNKIFASLSKDIEKTYFNNMKLYEKISLVLLNKKGKALFPNQEIFRENFLSKDFYNFKQCKYTLEKIEKFDNKKELIDTDELTIEHIMPQKLTPKWQIDLGKKHKEIYDKYLNKIGNLTLSGYNIELSNKNFNEKKDTFYHSNLSLNRELCTYEEWNEKSIQNRAIKLCDRALQIWKLPNIDPRYTNTNTDTNCEFDIMDDMDVTGREPYELNILGERISINSWRQFFKVICLKMYEYDSEIFSSLVKHKDFKGRKRRIITEDKDSLRVQCNISDSIFIEQNLSANDALNYSKLVIEKYDGMEDEISYKIK